MTKLGKARAVGIELIALYDLLGLMREEERLEMARWLADKPDVIAGMFGHSVGVFSRNTIAPTEEFNRQKGRPPGKGSGGRSRVGPGIVDGRHLQIPG